MEGRDGGFSVHLTAFSLDYFPSALELSYHVSLSLSLFFALSYKRTHT